MYVIYIHEILSQKSEKFNKPLVPNYLGHAFSTERLYP